MNIQEATVEYLGNLSVTKAHRTVTTYRTGLKHLCAMAGERDISSLNAGIVPEFVAWLQENTKIESKNSLTLYLVALSGFYKWVVLRELVPANAAELMRLKEWMGMFSAKRQRRTPRQPEEKGVQALLAYMRNTPPQLKDPERAKVATLRWMRDLAMIEMMRSTGCRISEVVNLAFENLRDREAEIVGKGSKQGMIYWDEQGWAALMTYIKATGNRTGFVFRPHGWQSRNEKVSISSTWHTLRVWYKRAGVPYFSPHKWRHRFGKRILDATHDLALTQDLMRHSSPETTRVYTQFQGEELKAGHASVKL